jgi:hypothetical protein
MGNIFNLLLGFSCLIILAIWYDRTKTQKSFFKNLDTQPLQLIFGLIFISVSCDVFLKKPEFQVSKRWGYPINNYANGLLALLVGVMLLWSAVKSNGRTSNKKDQKRSKKKK